MSLSDSVKQSFHQRIRDSFFFIYDVLSREEEEADCLSKSRCLPPDRRTVFPTKNSPTQLTLFTWCKHGIQTWSPPKTKHRHIVAELLCSLTAGGYTAAMLLPRCRCRNHLEVQLFQFYWKSCPGSSSDAAVCLNARTDVVSDGVSFSLAGRRGLRAVGRRALAAAILWAAGEDGEAAQRRAGARNPTEGCQSESPSPKPTPHFETALIWS